MSAGSMLESASNSGIIHQRHCQISLAWPVETLVGSALSFSADMAAVHSNCDYNLPIRACFNTTAVWCVVRCGTLTLLHG